jgi:hypothetical protein
MALAKVISIIDSEVRAARADDSAELRLQRAEIRQQLLKLENEAETMRKSIAQLRSDVDRLLASTT